MFATPNCPEPNRLRDYMLGRGDDRDAAALEEHLLSCATCAERLARTPATDELLAAVRACSSAGGPPPLPSSVEGLIGRLQRLLSEERSTVPPGMAAVSTGRSLPSAADHGLGEMPAMIGRYRIVKLLGQGGMGTVYQAADPDLGRAVAIKLPRFEGPEEATSEARQRFAREARAAATVRHPHVCPVYDVGEHEGQPFVVMAHVEGGSLARRLEARGRFDDSREAVTLTCQLAAALQAIHDHGLIHRDLKPANVLLDTHGPALLADFGLARIGAAGEDLTMPGMVLGTPAYMAPEQADLHRGEAGPLADQYSLGVVLFQMLTGQLPGGGPTRPPNRLAVPATLREIRPDLDPGLEAIVLRATAEKPTDRFPSAAAFAEALTRWMATHAAPPPSASPAGPGGRWRWLVVALLAAGLVLAGTLALWPWGLPPVSAGHIDVRVWEKGNERRQGLRLHEDGALPLRPNDKVRVDVQLDRPAYVYILWISTRGEVLPVYPWRQGEWGNRPDREQPVQRLDLPDEPGGWRIDAGPPGMETLVLLARRTPLPRDVDLAALLGELPVQKEQDLGAAVWFENGRVVPRNTSHDRGPRLFDADRIDDPVLGTQRRIKDRLQPLFDFTCGVSFANQGGS